MLINKILIIGLLVFVVGLILVPMAQGQYLPDIDVPGDEQDCGLTLSGKVLDHDTREVLVGATVVIPALNRAVVADEYGNYHFHHLCRGTYELKVTYVGYEPESFTIRLTSSTVRDLQLHIDAQTLKTVEVTGSHIREKAQSSQTLSGQQLEETRGLSLAQSLSSLAGVTTLQTGPNIAKPVIHGMHSSRVLLLNNGIRQEGQQWGTEHAPEIDPFIANEMEVIKGAAGVRYGADAIGGVVIVEPKPLPDSAGTSGELNLLASTNNRQLATSATLEGQFSFLPVSWRVQGTLKKAGNSATPEYYLQNTGFREQNFSAALGYDKEKYGVDLFYSHFDTKLGILRGAHIGNLSDLNFAIERGRPVNADAVDFTYEIERPYQDVLHQLLKAKAFLKTGESGQLDFTYGLQRNRREEFDVHNAKDTRPALQLNLITHTTEAVWNHAPVHNIVGSVGISTIYQDNTWKYNDFLPFYTGITAGAFVIEKWRKDRLQLEAGLRYDYKHLLVKRLEQDRTLLKPEYNFNNVSGTLGGLYDLGYHLTFGLSATSAWRAPGVNELFSDGVHHSAASFEKGNPNLSSEQAYNFEASVDYYGNIRLNGKLSVYQNYVNNYIYLAPMSEPILTIRGAFPAFEYKQTDAAFRGFDLNLEYNFTPNLMLNSTTSIVRARNLNTDDHLINIPPDRFDNNLRYTFAANDTGFLRKGYISAGGIYVAEQTRVPSKTEEDYAPAPDAYFLLHAEASSTLKLGKQNFEVGITGSNLLNTSYRDYLNRFRYFAEETGRLLMFRVKIPLDFSNQ